MRRSIGFMLRWAGLDWAGRNVGGLMFDRYLSVGYVHSVGGVFLLPS